MHTLEQSTKIDNKSPLIRALFVDFDARRVPELLQGDTVRASQRRIEVWRMPPDKSGMLRRELVLGQAEEGPLTFELSGARLRGFRAAALGGSETLVEDVTVLRVA